jgi:uncharacterized membrane protein YhaH (DUF805 family)
MTITRALFSFEGRLCRSDYWLKGFLPMLPLGIFNNILAYGVDADWARVLAFVIALLSLWPALALIVKRLHDRDQSGCHPHLYQYGAGGLSACGGIIRNNIIAGNQITSSTGAGNAGYGIALSGSHENVISDNDVSHFYVDIGLAYSHNNTIDENNIRSVGMMASTHGMR